MSKCDIAWRHVLKIWAHSLIYLINEACAQFFYVRFLKSVVSWALGVMGSSSKNNKIFHISSAIERHKKLFLSEKLEIIKLYENGNSEFKISREKCLTESMIKNILKRKHELMEQATTPNKYCSAMKCTINLRYNFWKPKK